MNNPPFSIGQEVICINSITRYYKKNEKYTIQFLDYCPNCKVWHVGCVECGKFQSMCICNYKGKGTTLAVVQSKHFAPIITNYSDATAEILEKFKSPSETPDKILTPEKVKV